MQNQHKLYPTDLTDRQWNLISDLIPSAKEGGRPREVDMRLVINAILYLLVGGIQWRMLPREYPKWQTVYYYFRRWQKDGTWQQMHDTLRAAARRAAGRHHQPTAGCLDSQSIKSAANPGSRGYDGGKKVTGRKRHLLVDTLGLLITVLVTSAALSDGAGARQMLRHLPGSAKKLRKIWVDGGYQQGLLDWAWQTCAFRLTTVVRPAGTRGFVVLARRWVVGRTFAWLTQCRRLDRDYETLPVCSEAMIHIAMIRLMLRRLAPS